MNDTREQVLEAVADGPIRGPTLAERLDVSRTAVWKHVEALREAGFAVESAEAGYELREVPDFGGEAVEYGLDAPYDVEYHDAIPSTNDRARELAVDGAADVVVLADEQTGGRGRLDRAWSSPSGGVWLSIVLRPNVPPARATLFTLAAAVATTRAARDVGVDASIKWPNDVLVIETGEGGGADGTDVTDEPPAEPKLAGILTEMEGEADRVSWLVVGIGVNANVDPEDVESDAPVTSLAAERGDPVDRRTFTQTLLEEFDALRTDLDSVLPAWRDDSATLGRRVSVDTPSGEISGEAVDLTPSGALVVETGDGEEVVTAGDCEHLRSETV